MRIRSALALIAFSATLAACGNVAGPMECEGNPKCKADLQPIVPNQLTLTTAPAATHLSPASGSTQTKIGANR